MSGPREIVSELDQAEDLTEFTDTDLGIMADTLDLEERETVFDPEPAAWWQARIEAAQLAIEREIDRRCSVAERRADRLMAGDRAPW